MSKEWTEEEMRQALFGNAEISARVSSAPEEEIQLSVAAVPVSKVAKKRPPKPLSRYL